MTPEERACQIGLNAVLAAMQRPTPEKEAEVRRRQQLERPQVCQPDEHGEMQVVGNRLNMEGWVSVEEYMVMLNYLEELEDVREAVNP